MPGRYGPMSRKIEALDSRPKIPAARLKLGLNPGTAEALRNILDAHSPSATDETIAFGEAPLDSGIVEGLNFGIEFSANTPNHYVLGTHIKMRGGEFTADASEFVIHKGPQGSVATVIGKSRDDRNQVYKPRLAKSRQSAVLTPVRNRRGDSLGRVTIVAQQDRDRQATNFHVTSVPFEIVDGPEVLPARLSKFLGTIDDVLFYLYKIRRSPSPDQTVVI